MIKDTKDFIQYRCYSDGEKAVDLQLCVGCFARITATELSCAAGHHLENALACQHLDQRYIFRTSSKLVTDIVAGADPGQSALYLSLTCRGTDSEIDAVVTALKTFVDIAAHRQVTVQPSHLFVPRVSTQVPARSHQRKTLRELVRSRRGTVLLTTYVRDDDRL